jgi:hypothetical protein
VQVHYFKRRMGDATKGEKGSAMKGTVEGSNEKITPVFGVCSLPSPAPRASPRTCWFRHGSLCAVEAERSFGLDPMVASQMAAYSLYSASVLCTTRE